MNKPIIQFSQNWPAYNQAQQREKELFMELLAELCSRVEEPKYKFGRPRNRLSEMLYCATFKIYSLYSGRRFTTDMEIAKEKGYITKVPHYNSVFNYFKMEGLTPILQELIAKSSQPLSSVEVDFAVDSTGFSTRNYDRWFDYKWTLKNVHKVWVKAHLMCGVKTHTVTAVTLTEGTSNDSPHFVPLVKRTAEKFCIQEISADKAYSSRENLDYVGRLGGMPFIPFRSNTTGKSRGSLTWANMYHYFMANREEFLAHYHKRSNVESTMNMIKSKFGASVKSKTKTAQFNEVLCKILCHNICVIIREMHEMGIFKPTIIKDIWVKTQS